MYIEPVSKKIFIPILLGSLVAIFINHFLVDWDKQAEKKARKSIEEIVRLQYQDLQLWKQGNTESLTFRKRTICNGRLIDWSDNRSFFTSLSNDSIQVISNDLGFFLIQKVSVDQCDYISSHQLLSKYAITNQYLTEQQSSLLHEKVKNISLAAGDYAYQDLFFFDVASDPSRVVDAVALLLIVFVILFTYWKYSQKGFFYFLRATVILVVLRCISILAGIFHQYLRYDLFDPIIYTSSIVNHTLGDLLLNCVLLNLIILSYARYVISSKTSSRSIFFHSAINTMLSGLVLHVAWSIISNSQLSLDVGNSIQFDLLRIVAFLCILLIATGYFYFTYLVLNLIRRSDFIIQAIIGAIAIAAVMGLLDSLSIAFSVIHISILLIAIRYQWGTSFKEFNYANLLFILTGSIGIAAVLAFCIYKYEEGAMIDAKKKFANYLLLKRDVLGEYYLDQTVKKLSADEELELIASEREKDLLEEKIRNEFLTPYFHKYTLEIIFQDYQKLKLNTRYTREQSLLIPSNQSDYDNIFFIDEGTNFKYICKINIGDLVGLIVLKIKKRLPTSVYPALLTDNKYFSATSKFDYAVFANDEILFHRSKFGRGEWLQKEDFEIHRLYDNGIEKNGRHYFGVKTQDGRIILIISKKYSASNKLTNFSVFFLLLLFSFATFSAFNTVYKYGVNLGFTGKIQLFLGVTFMLPLFIAGFAMLNKLQTSYQEEINRSYIKNVLHISEILSNGIDEASTEVESSFLTEIGMYTKSDLSFYNESGYLIATSQPEVFKLKLQSNLINPIVFDQLIAKGNQSIVVNESVGKLDYKVCYAIVNTIDNQVSGFVAMPFFDSKNHLKRQQIEVFGNLVSIFALIFIVAIIFGNVILNSLLQPLRMVAAKIRRVTLQEVNEPIEYESSDEIGSLVKDYNQMLVKLEDNKKALARSQKETAWKEIAKQVAHEIKNPLTPMQLKIQQMLRKSNSDSKEHETFTSLLTQIDTLSQIAESFSAFAEMPAPDNQLFDWGNLVKEVASLYRAEHATIDLSVAEGVVIEADEDIFRRILNNIVLNAIQSVTNKQADIYISLEEKERKGILSVRDNGKGISASIKDKIFLNYFSTKSTGSGIGLALAKKGIENAGGNIWFESKEGEGTTFFIAMPLAHH